MSPEIEQYLRTLLQEAGQSGIGEEIEKTLIGDLYPRLEAHLMLTALQHLSDEQQTALQQMALDQKTQAEIQAFLQQCIPNYEEVFAKALMDFRNAYIGEA